MPLALGFALAGCGVVELPVPLETRPSPIDYGACVLMHVVVDVVADPETGTPIDAATGEPFVWREGFRARRSLTGTEVIAPDGQVALITPGRYWLCPVEYLDGWVIGGVKPCPDCDLGPGVD